MATEAKIVRRWNDSRSASMVVSVANDRPCVNDSKTMVAVEYMASVPLLDEKGQRKDSDQLLEELLVSLKAQRDEFKAQDQLISTEGTVSL